MMSSGIHKSSPLRNGTAGFLRNPQSSPSTARSADRSQMNGHKSRGVHDGGDALSRLPPAQLREMRESFQVLDRDNNGIVTRDDVADMLGQLGVDASRLSQFPTQTNLASYLSDMATSLMPLSKPDELLAAFSAFDADDSGQVDVEELRRALLDTPPEVGERRLEAHEVDQILQTFSGRRAFKRGVASSASRGQVFRYNDFVSNVGGRASAEEDKEQAAAA